ncbi:MarR family winged helix-turn-helix transcriptional regulator [Novosphingobium piscinae]|uniref:MarR family transcriptional regulator n=1 Tax=Novosphingobium piscinae TaxID=1507448 RepID=A0A7X1FVQ1_9SPHN|nr:MarR family transcriptional regulator [Novosphingobium piscinae]MBC2667749.1 MarR family transcriptional regulator [Novosphingobium piscinae]
MPRTAGPAGSVVPAEQLAAGKAFFAEAGLDVRHFGAIWHLYKIGQLMATDLNAVSGRHGLSIADFHLLGALMMRAPEPLRATDLAQALNVTNAALSGRVRRLASAGLLICTPDPLDQRSRPITLTAEGADRVAAIARDLETQGRFVRRFHALETADQMALERIAAALHTALARDFVATRRGDA